MGARKDQPVSYSHLTQEEVEAFCTQWGIDPKFNPVAPGLDKSIDQCPVGSIALYCRHFEFSNLRHPFSVFVLNVLEYYRVSFGQLHPQGLARVLHFEVVCRAARYDPSLLSFRRFFRLAKNVDWFTFETPQVDACLISSMVTTLGSWKGRFFWVFESIVPFKMVRRHPDVVLNELEPSESELDSWFLKSIRACPSRLRPFPEHLLVLMGISKLWDKPDRDLVLMRGGQVMFALDFIRSDDTSDVVFTDAEATEGDDADVRGVEHRFEGSTYVNVPNVKGFTKVAASKASTHRSTRSMLKGTELPSGSETVDLSDDIEIPDDLEAGVEGKKKELPLVVGKESKTAGKKVVGLKGSGKIAKGSANVNPREIYVPGWKVMVGDSFKSSSICEDVLTHFAPPAVQDSCSSMDDDQMISKMILGIEALSAREKASSEEKEGLEASLAQVTKDNKWLIEHGFQLVITYLLHSSEFNRTLGNVYTKLLVHGRHQGYTAGYEACEAGTPKDKSSLYQPKAFEVLKDSVLKMEHLTYPYVSEVSECFGKPLSVLQELKPCGLNEVVCAEVLKSLSKKRPCSGDNEETCSEGGEGSEGSSLEASEAAGAGGRKKKKKKAKRPQDDANTKKVEAAKSTISDAAK
ncbi:hypothetical protein HanPI659440_Chr15g0598111 [Helianthus annuus]|nr:hypothetical protein HanPI659440_Chr15g0598111 [Helianthus annuus]